MASRARLRGAEALEQLQAGYRPRCTAPALLGARPDGRRRFGCPNRAVGCIRERV